MRSIGQRAFLTLWVVWAAIVSLTGALNLLDGHPLTALGVMAAVALIFALPIALLQFICLGSARPSALNRR